MSDIIFLLTKDCMSLESLPVYGNTYWKTPNIDELASKGTVWRKHYTAGGSTAMAVSAMLSGHYPYEFKSRKLFNSVIPSEYPSIFDYFQTHDYDTHIIWDISCNEEDYPKIREFGDEKKTQIHSLDIQQRTGAGKLDNARILRDDNALDVAICSIEETLEKIDKSKSVFVWMHLPHVLKGRRCYMDDMDAFDKIVGIVRKFAGDENIIITTDHGHMNMHKGKVGYGFDVYEPIIHIPLITPRVSGAAFIDFLTSNIDIPQLLKGDTVSQRDYVIVDTQYYYQASRVTAIVSDQYKYIYNKADKSEEFYDLKWDPSERYNILVDSYYDNDRNKELYYDEYFFYPYRNQALEEVKRFRDYKDTFVIEPTKKEFNKYRNELRVKRLKKMLTKLLR